MAQRRSRKRGRSRKEDARKPQRAERPDGARRPRTRERQAARRESAERLPWVDVRPAGMGGRIQAWGIGWLIIAAFVALMWFLDRWWVLPYPDSIWWMIALGAPLAAPSVGAVSRDRGDILSWTAHVTFVSLVALLFEVLFAPRCPVAGVGCEAFGALGSFGPVGAIALVAAATALAFGFAELVWTLRFGGDMAGGRRPWLAHGLLTASTVAAVAILVAVTADAWQDESMVSVWQREFLLSYGAVVGVVVVLLVALLVLRRRRGTPDWDATAPSGRTSFGRLVRVAATPFLISVIPLGLVAIITDGALRDGPPRAEYARAQASAACFGFTQRVPDLYVRADPRASSRFWSSYVVGIDGEDRKTVEGKRQPPPHRVGRATTYEAHVSVDRGEDSKMFMRSLSCNKLNPEAGAETEADVAPKPPSQMPQQYQTRPLLEDPAAAGAQQPMPLPQ